MNVNPFNQSGLSQAPCHFLFWGGRLHFIPFSRTAREGNISAWLRWRGRLHTLKQANFGVCSHFFSVSPQTTRNCVVGFLKKILKHPFAPTLLRRACTRVSPFHTIIYQRFPQQRSSPLPIYYDEIQYLWHVYKLLKKYATIATNIISRQTSF